jgi:hypothetical protein
MAQEAGKCKSNIGFVLLCQNLVEKPEGKQAH